MSFEISGVSLNKSEMNLKSLKIGLMLRSLGPRSIKSHGPTLILTTQTYCQKCPGDPVKRFLCDPCKHKNINKLQKIIKEKIHFEMLAKYEQLFNP